MSKQQDQTFAEVWRVGVGSGRGLIVPCETLHKEKRKGNKYMKALYINHSLKTWTAIEDAEVQSDSKPKIWYLKIISDF